MYGALLFFHILAATVWAGGHIVLSTLILPKVLRTGAVAELLEFESKYERVGMPALLIQIITGFGLAFYKLPNISDWFDVTSGSSMPILAKMSLLTLTFCFALNARFRVIPKLNADTLNLMAFHIVSVTLLSILFVFVGVSFRTGWMY